MLTIELAGESVTLLHERALHWPRRRALILADLHLGKAAAFRALGAPAPEAATAHDLRRLDLLLNQTRAERLIILGDLLHARAGLADCVLSAAGDWARRAEARGVSITLVRGNHDLAAGDPPDDWGVECCDPPCRDGPFAYRHEPHETSGAYTLCGHLHPSVMLDCPTGVSMRTRCFWFSPAVGVLPAFGSFTGAKVFRPRPGDRVYLVGEDAVVEAPVAAASAQR